MQACYKCGATKPIECFYTTKKREPCQKCNVCRGMPPVQQKKSNGIDRNHSTLKSVHTNPIDQDLLKMWFCFQADIDNFTDPLYKILPHVMAS